MRAKEIQNDDDADAEFDLLELRGGVDERHSELEEYVNHLNVEEVSPQLSIVVEQKLMDVDELENEAGTFSE